MNSLLDNAVQSLQLGIEDYQAGAATDSIADESDLKRTLSAVRNFYAGILLLGKAVLVRQAPNANDEELLYMAYEPEPDGDGGVKFVRRGKRTVGFEELGKRLRRFGVPVDRDALKELNQVRNGVEHHFVSSSISSVQACIARAFPVVSVLFRHGKFDPVDLLGDSWQSLLSIREFYERERAECRQTFSNIYWLADVMKGEAIWCPYCKTDLVEQSDVSNSDQNDMECKCRACGEAVSAEHAIAETLRALYEGEIYIADTDGGESPLYACRECGADTYLLTEDHNGCAFCGEEIEGDCGGCGAPLTPENVPWDGSVGLCSYCSHVRWKDD